MVMLPKKIRFYSMHHFAISTFEIVPQLNDNITIFLTQVISRRQKNADAKVALSISRRQKWNLRR